MGAWVHGVRMGLARTHPPRMRLCARALMRLFTSGRTSKSPESISFPNPTVW
jgi:hypothetical protein